MRKKNKKKGDGRECLFSLISHTLSHLVLTGPQRGRY